MTDALVKTTPGVSLSTVNEMWRFAKIAAMSGHLRTDLHADAAISDAVMRIQAGAELGIGPHAAMAGILFIQGQQTFKANLVAALVKSSGKYDYKVLRTDDTACLIEWFQDGEHVGESEFTEADRERAGLALQGRRGGDSNWKKYPKAMMFARALTQGARMYCPDVFIGGVYTPEEIKAEVVDDDAPEAAPVEPDAPVDAEFEEPPADDATPVEYASDDEVRAVISAGMMADTNAAAVKKEFAAAGSMVLTDVHKARLAVAMAAINLLNGYQVPSAVWADDKAKTRAWNLTREFHPELASAELDIEQHLAEAEAKAGE